MIENGTNSDLLDQGKIQLQSDQIEPGIRSKLKPKKLNYNIKKPKKLVNNLMRFLLDTLDSDYRKRHVKRLIYGEDLRIKK